MKAPLFSRSRPNRSGIWSPPRAGTYAPGASSALVDPKTLYPFLLFYGTAGITTDGGSVEEWSQSTGKSGQLSRNLVQTTASEQPLHDSSGGFVQFDAVDKQLDFSSAVEQAGILVTATSNGIFAYEVDADSVATITALGKLAGYFQSLGLYAYILFPATVTDQQLEGVILWLLENTGATKNPAGSLAHYWHARADLVAPKSMDFSGATNFSNAWDTCTSMTSLSVTGLDSAANFYATWYNCSSLVTMPAIPLTAATDFRFAWSGCASMTAFLATGFNLATTFYYAWNGCTSLANFPAGLFDNWSPASRSNNCFSEAWNNCTALTATSVENILNSLATAGVAAPSSGVDITIDHAAGSPSVATAVGVLKGLSPPWTITLNGVAQ